LQPKLLKHTTSNHQSFKIWKNADPYLHNPWHFHPEIELTLIVRGMGTRFVGDNIQPYYDGDLVLIGENLPHEWRSEISPKNSDYQSKSLAIHFLKDFLGNTFYDLPEVGEINHLIHASRRGLKINDSTIAQKIYDELNYLLTINSFEKIIGLFEILNLIARAKDRELLSSDGFVESFSMANNHKINDIYQYIIKNFRQPIRLEEVAEQVFMTPNSFCRFFKKCTNKSFVQYLNEVRIGYACKLLLEDKFNISQIAYESGFNNLSNFNKNFKAITGKTPSEYFCKYLKEV